MYWVKDNITVTENKCKLPVTITHIDGTTETINTLVINATDKQMREAGYIAKDEYIKKEIDKLKSLLTESDYKILKCYEASLQEKELPYELNAVIALRDGYRDKINELEEELKEYLA